MGIWQRLRLRGIEKRQSQGGSYTDALVSLIQGQASGGSALPGATGALESSASIVARCFAAAQVQAPRPFQQALTPALMSMVGRALIRSGEIVFAIDTQGGLFKMLPCSSYDVSGGPNPASWRYRLTISGPDSLSTMSPVPAEGLVHIRLQSDPQRPWRGISPLSSASLAGKLSAETEAALGDEASGPRGYLLPIPVGGDDPSVDELKADIRTLGGSIATVESQAAGWARDGGATRPNTDWKPMRLGANPPVGLVTAAENASREVYAACGIPYSLVVDSAANAAREGYRRLLHSTVVPIARIVEAELSEKMEADIKISFDSLFAGDLSGRARSFQNLVLGGMGLDKAAGLAGLLEADDS